MKKIAVIGHPVSHSLSPFIHNAWIEEYRLNAKYDAVDIAPENLKTQIRSMIADGYVGFNVTIPHKIAVMDICDTIDESAKNIGAVNLIAVSRQGKIQGFNTDGFGFIANIKTQKPSFDFSSGAALIIGAGGATRAIIDGLMQQNIPEIYVTNRTRSKVADIAKTYNINIVDWEQRHRAVKNAALLVNATSLGMVGQPPLEIDLSRLSANALVCDIVYKPLMTDLLLAAAAQGNGIVTGLGMLLHQARPSFKKWFGVLPDISDKLRMEIEQKAAQ